VRSKLSVLSKVPPYLIYPTSILSSLYYLLVYFYYVCCDTRCSANHRNDCHEPRMVRRPHFGNLCYSSSRTVLSNGAIKYEAMFPGGAVRKAASLTEQTVSPYYNNRQQTELNRTNWKATCCKNYTSVALTSVGTYIKLCLLDVCKQNRHNQFRSSDIKGSLLATPCSYCISKLAYNIQGTYMMEITGYVLHDGHREGNHLCSVITVGVRAQMWTKGLPHTEQECEPFDWSSSGF
jgi:hypothetical protein